MRINRSFLFFVGVYFSIQAVFHFVRLAFNWEIHVYDVFFFPYWGSALYFIVSVFLVYWILRTKKSVKKRDEKENNLSDSKEVNQK